jgi:prepilin-type N-terminal cleavage/methylation domain-containing protein
MHTTGPINRAFTLIELLVVIAVIGILCALLLPALAGAKERGRRVACLSNLRQIGVAIHGYAEDNDGNIPYGPKAPPYTNPSDFYPSTGAPTSLISLQSGAPVGLGLLLQYYIAEQPRILFCPSSDQLFDTDAELAKVGITQSQSSYYYRHAGDTAMHDSLTDPPPQNIELDNLGNNRNNLPIRALAIDTEFISPAALSVFGVNTTTHHQQISVNILFSDGHSVTRANPDGRFTVTLATVDDLTAAFSKILGVLEQADTEP